MKKFQIDTGNTLLTGLKAYYKLENIFDSCGAYNLTNYGSTPFNAAKIGNGADFGTSNSSKYLRQDSNLGINGGPCSISFLGKINTEPSTNASGIFASEGGQLSGYEVSNHIFYRDSGGTKNLYFTRLRQGVAWDGTTYNITLGTSNFNHIVYTYDGTNIRGYLNGNLVAGPTAASGTGNTIYSEIGTRIGARCAGSPSDYSSAIIDEVGIWSKALSTQEITDLYNNGNGQTMMFLLAQILEF